ncbi:amidohydrolase family protein [Paenibacillus sp. GCM10023248]|uniref:amidohydrolase family protein n=1 Tax=Bacillales TaxID=1385 RepID=UPI002377D2B9|nr:MULTISPECIES: amidohydrolase family protein [Bacillales]MDD9272251.1 amidohydrolase family protein [Paenibacillus sp. MAHUQ-63]MDR6885378.1 L-fuconolactonase [Bacillus sp. 3255]
MRIDAHQHYWTIDRGDYGWIGPELPVLYRDYLPEDLSAHLQRHQLDRTIAVQAAPTLAETDYLLSLSEGSETIAGVVGWLDLSDPEHLQHYARFREHPKYVGFRVMIQEMPDASVILQPSYVEALRYFAREDVPVDLLVKSQQLEAVVELLDKVPGLRGVIDHIAKPQIAAGVTEPWKSQMTAIAKHPGIYCKLSGMVTEADHERWQEADFTGYIRHVLDVFGSERVMFGSDWPVCLLAADYDEVMQIVQRALPETWTDRERERLFGLNAKEFYKL